VDKLCDHGCGRIAVAFSKSSKLWRCEINTMKCPALKRSQSKILSKVKETQTHWTKLLTEDELRVWKEAQSVRAIKHLKEGTAHGCFGKNYYNTVTQKAHARLAGSKGGGLRSNSGRGKSGMYKGIWCQSTWELAFLIWHVDHKIDIKRNTKRFRYTFYDKTRWYYPDFLVENILYEIKGYFTDEVYAKLNAVTEEIKIIDKESIKPYIDYCCDKFNVTPDNLYSLYEERNMYVDNKIIPEEN
jgi:hypothetical protein